MIIKQNYDSTDNSASTISTKKNQNNNCIHQKRNFIHQRFIQLKQELKLIKCIRKTQINSLKKCKLKLFKIIHNAIKHCTNYHSFS